MIIPFSKFVLTLAFPLIAAQGSAGTFAFKEDAPSTGVLTITDGDQPVLTYRYSDQLQPGVDAKYTRSSYIHPIYSLDGAPLTDDFPVDHFHHRGLSWTWPFVETRSTQTQTWAPSEPPLRQQFSRWVERTVSNDAGVTLTVENNWVLSSTENVAREQVAIHVHPANGDGRIIDIAIRLEAIGGPLTLRGTKEGNKGYGGFAVRMAPQFKGARLLTSNGPEAKDVVLKPMQWADLTDKTGGLAIVAAPSHPGYPPSWMARNSYAGFINVSWPGMEPVTLVPGTPVTLSYRLLVHRAGLSPEKLEAFGRTKIIPCSAQPA